MSTVSSSLRDRSTRRLIGLVAVLSCGSAVGVDEARAAESTNEASKGLEEIVVTAQRRAERLQDVPISITALNGDALDESTDVGVTAALRMVPGVATTNSSSGGGTQISIRGVTAAGPALNGSSPIGYYLDSVPFGLLRSAIAPDPNAYDLDRIEVLRGPQGTLYGVNAQNGVVRVLTRDADPSKFEFKMRAAASSTKDGGGNYRGDMAVNVPIIDGKLAVRAVAGYEELGGWIDRPFRKDANGSELSNGRIKVDAQPTENLSIGLLAWLSRNDFESRSTGPEDRTNPSRIEEPNSTDYDVYGFKIEYDFPAFTLSSVTSYIDYSNFGVLDYETVLGGPANVGVQLHTRLDSEVLSEEVYFQSTNTGSWQWTLGGMYRDAEDRFFQWRRTYVNPNGNRSIDSSKSYAVFGEVTRVFADRRFEVTAGLRYFEDEQEMQELSRPSSAAPPGGLFTRNDKFDALSPRAVLKWHPTKQLMTYVSYAEGFRSGFAQLAVVLESAPDFPAVDSDNLVNYEWGGKGSVWDGLLSFEVAAFYIDWSDIQQSLTVQGTSGAGQLISVNAPVNGESASGLGAEIGLALRPLSGLQLAMSYSWNDLTMDADVFAPNGRLLFLEGDRLTQSPEETIRVSADYAFSLGTTGYEGRIAASAAYNSELYRRALIDGVSRVIASDDLLLAQISFAIDLPGNWTTMLFVDNLTDEEGSPFSDPNPVQNVRLQPRTAGVQFEYRF